MGLKSLILLIVFRSVSVCKLLGQCHFMHLNLHKGPFKLALHNEVFLACNMYCLELISQLFWACHHYTKYARVLWCNFLQHVSQCWEKIHCKLQKVMLHVAISSCNGFKTIHAIVAERRTDLYFVQWLQAQ